MSELVLAFVKSLPENQWKILRWYMPFLDYAEKKANYEPPVQKVVDFGSPVGELIITGRTEQEAIEAAAGYLDMKEEMISYLADDYFEEEVVRPATPCILPEHGLARERHVRSPVFGLLLAHHDVRCIHCGAHSGEGFEERQEEAERTLTELPLEKQEALVSLAQRFITHVFSREGYPIVDSNCDDVAEHLRIIGHPHGECALTRSIYNENLLWLGQNPYFGRDLSIHADKCPELTAKFSTYERAMVGLLTEQDRTIYHRLAQTLANGHEYLYARQ